MLPEDTNPTFSVDTLPEDIRSNPAFEGIDSYETLARKYVESANRPAGGFDAIPEELRADPNIAKYKTPADLAKGHLEAIKLIGKRGVTVPGEGASDEEWSSFFNSVGRPEKPEAYQFKTPEGIDERIQVTPESETAWKQAAHKMGLTQQQAQGLMDWHMGIINNSLKQQDEQQSTIVAQAQKQLRDEWGPEYTKNLTLAKRVVEKFGGKDALSAFGDLGNNPVVLKTLASFGNKISEDSIARGEFNELLGSSQEARRQLDDINKRMAAMTGSEPDYSELVKKRTELYKIAYPDTA